MNELKGKLVIAIAYPNWSIPDSIKNTSKLSTILSLVGVVCWYELSNVLSGLVVRSPDGRTLLVVRAVVAVDVVGVAFVFVAVAVVLVAVAAPER